MIATVVRQLRINRKSKCSFSLVTLLVWALITNFLMPGSTTSAAGCPSAGVIPGLANVTHVAAGLNHSLFFKSDGTVWGVGSNSAGELGNGSTAFEMCSPVQALISNVVEIAAGAAFSLARKSDGTVWAWGGNPFGNIGDGIPTTSSRLVPVQVRLDNGLPLSGATNIAAGIFHGLAVVAGTVRAWGRNDSGQLGIGVQDAPFTGRFSAIRVLNLDDAVQVSAGQNHSLARRSNKKVRAWGNNSAGQVGDGSAPGTVRTIPVSMIDKITGAAFDGSTFVSAGIDFSVVTTADNKVWVAGPDGSARLGNGCVGSTDINASNGFLVKVPLLGKVLRAVSGSTSQHFLAIKTDGTLVSWGSNEFGQLGDGSMTTRCSKVVSAGGLAGFQTVAVGQYHSLAVRLDMSGISTLSWGNQVSCILGRSTC